MLSLLSSCLVSLRIMRVSSRQIIALCFHANKIPGGKNILKNQKARMQLLWACSTLLSPPDSHFSSPWWEHSLGVPGSCKELGQNAGTWGTAEDCISHKGLEPNSKTRAPHCKEKLYSSSSAANARRDNLKSLSSLWDMRSESESDISGEFRNQNLIVPEKIIDQGRNHFIKPAGNLCWYFKWDWALYFWALFCYSRTEVTATCNNNRKIIKLHIWLFSKK